MNFTTSNLKVEQISELRQIKKTYSDGTCYEYEGADFTITAGDESRTFTDVGVTEGMRTWIIGVFGGRIGRTGEKIWMLNVEIVRDGEGWKVRGISCGRLNGKPVSQILGWWKEMPKDSISRHGCR